MYKAMATVSFIIRQFFLPNPFECFGSMALIYNWVAGLILAPISFALVGTVYTSGEAPAFGGFLYLIVYALLTGILWILGQFCFARWAIVGMITLIIGSIILLKMIRGDCY